MKHKIAAYWQMSATIEVEADSLEDAIRIVNEPEFPLPTNSDYVEGSFQIDVDSTIDANQQILDINK